jgi:protocatechuate 3,4-dioxygenase, beta subunit
MMNNFIINKTTPNHNDFLVLAKFLTTNVIKNVAFCLLSPLTRGALRSITLVDARLFFIRQIYFAIKIYLAIRFAIRSIRYFIFLLVFILSCSCPIFAKQIDINNSPLPSNINSCKPSKEYLNNYEPEIFPKTNNLLRKPGEFPIFCGEKLLVKGKLVDKNCVPIVDAKISIWQVACDGKYPYKPLRKRFNNNSINLNSKSTFLGAGTTTTDNKGEFYFITTYPPSKDKAPPHINLRVSHKDFSDFDTRIFPTNIPAEEEPEDFVSPNVTIEDTLVNKFKIVLPIKNKMREF